MKLASSESLSSIVVSTEFFWNEPVLRVNFSHSPLLFIGFRFFFKKTNLPFFKSPFGTQSWRQEKWRNRISVIQQCRWVHFCCVRHHQHIRMSLQCRTKTTKLAKSNMPPYANMVTVGGQLRFAKLYYFLKPVCNDFSFSNKKGKGSFVSYFIAAVAELWRFNCSEKT